MATPVGEENQFLVPWKAVKHRGVVLFEFCTELDKINNLKVRDDDVWICTFPRSGTTLTQEIVYLVQTGDFEKARTELLDDRAPFIDVVHSEIRKLQRGVKYVEELPSPRVIKTHLHHFLLPEELRAGKGKDKRSHIRKIANFLGKPLTEGEITRIHEHTDIANMQENAAVNNTWHQTTLGTDTDYGAFINDGSIDGWRTEVPLDLQEKVAAMVQEKLGHTDLTF